MMSGSCLLTGRKCPHNIPCSHAHRPHLVSPVYGQPKPTTGQRVTHSLCIQIPISPSKHCGFGPWLASWNTGIKVTTTRALPTTKSDWASRAYKISLWVLLLWVVSMIIASIIPASLLRAVFTWLSKVIGFGFGFGFTTPFGWLVYLLWFWFYDSQVKTALFTTNQSLFSTQMRLVVNHFSLYNCDYTSLSHKKLYKSSAKDYQQHPKEFLSWLSGKISP